MNKKMVIGTLIGALVLIAMIASAASAGSGFAAGSLDDDETGTVYGGNTNGDCDRTRDQLRSQDRDTLQDGSCGECAGQMTDGAGDGTGVMNQIMLGLQKHMRSMSGEAFGEHAFKYMFQGTLV